MSNPPGSASNSWGEFAILGRSAAGQTAFATFGGLGGYLVGALAENIMPSGGPWWAIGVTAITWAALAVGALGFHWLNWRWPTRHDARSPGAWTFALGDSRTIGAIGGIAVGGVVAVLFSAAASNQSKASVLLGVVIAMACVVTVVALWYLTIGLRLQRVGEQTAAAAEPETTPLRGPGEPVPAVWIGGHCSSTWDRSRQPPRTSR